MKKTNLGKKYDPPLSLYPMTLDQVLDKVLKVPIQRVVDAGRREKEKEKAEVSPK